MNKYHNDKVSEDGIVFDSKAERRRYRELKLMEQAGEITNLRLQPEYELIPKYTKNGKTVRAVKYRADFLYRDRQGHVIVEDVKGVKTDVYRLKKKIFEYKYPDLTIKEINYHG